MSNLFQLQSYIREGKIVKSAGRIGLCGSPCLSDRLVEIKLEENKLADLFCFEVAQSNKGVTESINFLWKVGENVCKKRWEFCNYHPT